MAGFAGIFFPVTAPLMPISTSRPSAHPCHRAPRLSTALPLDSVDRTGSNPLKFSENPWRDYVPTSIHTALLMPISTSRPSGHPCPIAPQQSTALPLDPVDRTGLNRCTFSEHPFRGRRQNLICYPNPSQDPFAYEAKLARWKLMNLINYAIKMKKLLTLVNYACKMKK